MVHFFFHIVRGDLRSLIGQTDQASPEGRKRNSKMSAGVAKYIPPNKRGQASTDSAPEERGGRGFGGDRDNNRDRDFGGGFGGKGGDRGGERWGGGGDRGGGSGGRDFGGDRWGGGGGGGRDYGGRRDGGGDRGGGGFGSGGGGSWGGGGGKSRGSQREEAEILALFESSLNKAGINFDAYDDM